MHKTLLIISFIFCLNQDANLSAYEFDGYPCADDCSGHQAGYEWAIQNRATKVSDCASHSRSFTEGCKSYVQGSSGYINRPNDSYENEGFANE